MHARARARARAHTHTYTHTHVHTHTCMRYCAHRAIETGAVLLLENLDEDMDDMIEQVSPS